MRAGPGPERNLTFTVISVTVLSTLAMVVYPILAEALAFDALASGVFIGASIHDVAQVVGAGFSLSGWALLVAIAAVGMKTSLRRIFDVGGQAVTLIVAETLFIMAVVVLGVRYLV